MLSIDRTANTSVRDQLVEQLRYRIASGQYRVDDPLPSTRKLGDQLGISFHTVRKAYQALQEDGLVESEVGRGYVVKERTPLDKGERMERGAAIINETLQQLIGLGLEETEIEYLFQEQASLLDHASYERKLILVGSCQELNRLCADQIATSLQRAVDPVRLEDAKRHQDADYIFTPYAHLQEVMRTAPRADTLGFVTYLPSETLERVARLEATDTLGLVTRYAETIQPLMQQIRSQTEFAGQVMAASVDDETEHLESFLDEITWVVYTPECRRRLLPLLDDSAHRSVAIKPIVSQDSLDSIREAVPL